MIKGITTTGFKYEIQKSDLNDYELIENLADLEEDPLLISSIVRQVLGKEQAKKLKDHVRIEDGTVPVDKMTKEITDIFKNGGEETKNS